MLHCVVWYILTDVSEELTVFIIRVISPDDGKSINKSIVDPMYLGETFVPET
jgi:hypothetical protein